MTCMRRGFVVGGSHDRSVVVAGELPRGLSDAHRFAGARVVGRWLSAGVLAVLLVLACAGAAAGATGVVDDNGGAGTDYASMQAAVGQLMYDCVPETEKVYKDTSNT
ncbi:MAG: hypothetical protein U9Q37_10945 [Euryarchaeota archaeon]|nr:hypothetical protein [Euryarchaeota archaeon]